MLEGKPRETYTQYEADSLDFFEDPSIGDRRPLIVDEKLVSDSGAGSISTSVTTQTESEAPRIELENKPSWDFAGDQETSRCTGSKGVVPESGQEPRKVFSDESSMDTGNSTTLP